MKYSTPSGHKHEIIKILFNHKDESFYEAMSRIYEKTPEKWILELLRFVIEKSKNELKAYQIIAHIDVTVNGKRKEFLDFYLDTFPEINDRVSQLINGAILKSTWIPSFIGR